MQKKKKRNMKNRFFLFANSKSIEKINATATATATAPTRNQK